MLKFKGTHHDDPFLLSGSSVLDGKGYGLVLCVGNNSQLGIMKSKIDQHFEDGSLMKDNLERIVGYLLLIGVITAVIFFGVLTLHFFEELHHINESFFSKHGIDGVITIVLESFMIILLAVPDGLPLIMTLSLNFVVKQFFCNQIYRLSSKNITVRKLNSTIVMGGVTELICDKTGTITRCSLSVSHAYLQERLQEFDNNQLYSSNKNKLDNNCKQIVSDCIQLIVNSIKNEDQQNISPEDFDLPQVSKIDQTDEALMTFIQQINPQYIKTQEKSIRTISMNQSKKYSAIFIRYTDKIRMLIKGEPEFLMNCSTNIINSLGEVNQFTENKKKYVNDSVIKQFGNLSLRPIGICYRDFKPNQDVLNIDFSQLNHDFIFCGILGLKDKIRKTANYTLSKLQGANINVRIVTGDHMNNAINYARICDLIVHEVNNPILIKDNFVMNGQDFEKAIGGLIKIPQTGEMQVVNIEAFKNITKNLKVLARASAEHRLMLVIGLRQCDKIVAMIGDGNNDGLALKKAHIGFSLGLSGSQIARQSASILFMDDNLQSLISATQYGRNVFETIQRFIFYTIPFFVTVVFVMIYFEFVNRDNPIKVAQGIWLSIFHNIICTIALSTEIPNKTILMRRQFLINDPIIDPPLLKVILAQIAYMCINLMILQQYLPVDIHHASHDHPSLRTTIIYQSYFTMACANLLVVRKVHMDEINNFYQIWSNNGTILYMWTFAHIIQYCSIEYMSLLFLTVSLEPKWYLICHAQGVGLIIFTMICKYIVNKQYPLQDVNITLNQKTYMDEDESTYLMKDNKDQTIIE